jgi:ectoine hydroxylase-related dioxygenase (phytanoyl-CoA dioxygenase family)
MTSMTIPVDMKAGDVLFISGKVVHGGGANRSVDISVKVLLLLLNRNT